MLRCCLFPVAMKQNKGTQLPCSSEIPMPPFVEGYPLGSFLPCVCPGVPLCRTRFLYIQLRIFWVPKVNLLGVNLLVSVGPRQGFSDRPWRCPKRKRGLAQLGSSPPSFEKQDMPGTPPGPRLFTNPLARRAGPGAKLPAPGGRQAAAGNPGWTMQADSPPSFGIHVDSTKLLRFFVGGGGGLRGTPKGVRL